MGNEAVILKTERLQKKVDLPAIRVAFSAHQCLALDNGEEDKRVIQALATYLAALDNLAIFGEERLLDYFFQHAPSLAQKISWRVIKPGESAVDSYGFKPASIDQWPKQIEHVFLCETLIFQRMQMKERLPEQVHVIEIDDLCHIDKEAIPTRAWTPIEHNIYPIKIPEIAFRENLDLLLIDCPSRNLSMMPNGLGYVHNALKKAAIDFQTFDLDIVVYHRYHLHRLYDMGGKIILPSGKEAPTDPWQAENYDFWTLGSEHDSERQASDEVLAFFRPIIDEIVAAIVKARPKILGLSIQQCNEAFSRQVVNGVKEKLPDTLIIVGGYSCYNPDIGRRAFPECDYMFIGEAELTVAPVIEAIANGEQPHNQPGVLSRFDTPDYRYIPGPMPHNIDQIEFPKYEWFDDLSIYQNYNGYQLTPIIASRGCRWSRCTFCAERFYWRIRSAANFVDELEWLIDQGSYLFMFNESDLNGMPEKVLEICDEIISRGLHKRAKLTGQLRIHKKCNRAFFDKLRAANFVALRFGVDAFSENTLRLQKKGYTVEMAEKNLRDCWEAGIYTEVNWVIGIPGETEQDVDEGIDMILRNQQYIGRLANINPLIMVNGGVYWIDPDTHHIVFRAPKEELYEKYPRAMPANMWYSTEPYIDAQVRKERFERIVLSLYDAGFPVGVWANRVIDDVKTARDKMRAAALEDTSDENDSIESAATEAPISDVSEPVSEVEEAETKAVQEPIAAQAEEALSDDEPEITVEPPVFIRETESHRIIRYVDWYYAVPIALGEIDLASCDMSQLDGVVRATSEEDLMQQLAESTNWANSRGNYTPQKKQREQGAEYRAGSFMGARSCEPLDFDPIILSYQQCHYAVNSEDWQQIYEGNDGNDSGKTTQTHPDEPLILGDSLSRRFLRKLPRSIQLDIRQAVEHSHVSKKKPFFEILKTLMTRRTKPASAQNTSNATIGGVDILGVISDGAVPELMWAIENHNIVKFDNMYYSLPFGLAIDWQAGTVANLPGVLVDSSLKSVIRLLEEKLGKKISEPVALPSNQPQKSSGPADDFSKVPKLLISIEDYNIVSYEGWVYGIPQSLGDVDLTEIDIMEVEGVIRDVSRDVVENEIHDKLRVEAEATVD